MSELIESLLSLIEEKTNHDKERQDCAEDWGYFGHDHIERLESAEKRFQEELDIVIDVRVGKFIEDNIKPQSRL